MDYSTSPLLQLLLRAFPQCISTLWTNNTSNCVVACTHIKQWTSPEPLVSIDKHSGRLRTLPPLLHGVVGRAGRRRGLTDSRAIRQTVNVNEKANSPLLQFVLGAMLEQLVLPFATALFPLQTRNTRGGNNYVSFPVYGSNAFRCKCKQLPVLGVLLMYGEMQM